MGTQSYEATAGPPATPVEPHTRFNPMPTPMLRAVRLAAAALLLVPAACDGARAIPTLPGTEVPSQPAAPVIVVPEDPGPADVRFEIDAGTRTPISRFIYGVNSYHEWKGIDLPANLTLGRQGGNRSSAYNWENNASNAGSDWSYSSDSHMGGGEVPGEAVRPRVAGTLGKGAAMIVTVPMLGYVAADKKGPTGRDEAGAAVRLATRFKESRPRKGAAFSMRPDTTDRHVYQDEYVWWLSQTFPEAKTDPTRPIFYQLDNEPDLWHLTHEEVRSKVDGKHQLLTYDEMVKRTVEYAGAIKDVVPGAQTFGPGVATWSGVTNLGRWPTPDPVAGTSDFFDYFLKKMRAAEEAHGRRFLDVLTLNWYAEAKGDGRRVIDDYAPNTPAMVQARIQSPRSLWDPAYDEGSWVSRVIGGPIRLLPRLREKIAAHYPGTKLAITEYYYGGGGDISGGIAQADVLGIFGREGVFAAALWPHASLGAFGNDGNRAYAYIFGGFRMFRDYDGRGGSFGDLGLAATSSDVVKSSVYASADSRDPGRVVVVAINKTDAPLRAGITVSNHRALRTAQVYTLTSASPLPQRQADLPLSLRNALAYTMPPMSVTTLVLTEK